MITTGTPIDCAYTVGGRGPAVILVHGIGSRRQAWDTIAYGLERAFTVVRYDLRGHGESPLPRESFGLGDLVADIEALRQKLDLNRVHIVGHSLGGMIGPAYARLYPSQVATLSLVSTAAFRTEDDRKTVLGVVDAIAKEGLDRILPVLVKRWFTDAFAERRPEVVQRRLDLVRSTDFSVFLNVFRIYAETEMAPWLHEVSTPTLVTTGEFDGGCSPRLNEQIARALPDSKLQILNGLKHDVLSEAPDRVLRVVLAFLEHHAEAS